MYKKRTDNIRYEISTFKWFCKINAVGYNANWDKIIYTMSIYFYKKEKKLTTHNSEIKVGYKREEDNI